jgi:hypothetical protein
VRQIVGYGEIAQVVMADQPIMDDVLKHARAVLQSQRWRIPQVDRLRDLSIKTQVGIMGLVGPRLSLAR